MIKKFMLLEDATTDKDAKAGTTVYDCTRYDYGCSVEDTMLLGEEWVSVTFKEDGDYPFFTVPKRILAEIER